MKKYFNKETIEFSASLVQPMFPTNKEYRSHFYNEEQFGIMIKRAMQSYCSEFRNKLVKCTTKEEIQELISKMPFPKWPVYSKPFECNVKELEKANIKWWTEGFGKVIRTEWNIMFEKFVKYLNELV